MTEWHHEDTDHLLHEQRSILMSNVSPVKQAMQAVLERLQAILQDSLAHESARVTSSYLSAVASI
jgi:hypothetical protein